MRQPSSGAALAVALIASFLRFPQASGVHLVSNQPTGTDNQSNPPVQYVPKMASKLGLPQPQNRDSEILTDEALATALRHLVDSHKRQSAFIERLVALGPKPKTQENSYQPKKKANPPTRTSQTSTKTSETMVMRPEKNTDKMYPPESRKNPDPKPSNQTLVEKVTLRISPPSRIEYPNKPLHNSNPPLIRRFISYPPPNSPDPAHLPMTSFNTHGFYPHLLGEVPQTQSILMQQHPSFALQYQQHPSFAVQYPYNVHSVNTQTVSPVPHDYKEHSVNTQSVLPASHDYKAYSVNTQTVSPVSHDYKVHSVNTQSVPPVYRDFKVQYPANTHVPDVNLHRYFYSGNTQPTTVFSPVSQIYGAQNPPVNSHQYSYRYPNRP